MKTRRTLLQRLPAIVALPLLLSRPRAEVYAATAGNMPKAPGPAEPVGYRVPTFSLVYECDVTLQGALDVGKLPEGFRRVIPITGGTFRGPAMAGTVVPGGADWNLQRSDGAGSVEAAYYLRTDDGVLIRIVNRGVGGASVPAAMAGELFFMFTTPEFQAPEGKYDWLNRSTFVGTLGARQGRKDAVLIRVFQVV